MKIGDLVRYEDVETGTQKFGHITDAMEDNTGWYMYEVVCTDP